MKFEVKCRDSNEVDFIADIDADESTPESVKLGLAVKWAKKNKVSLIGCNLRGAHLYNANIHSLDMREADLSEANLYQANLSDCDLRDALLINADLRKSDLSGTNLTDSDLSGADISGADLDGTTGNMKEIRTMMVEFWSMSFTRDTLQIGAIAHPIKQWRAFTDEESEFLATYEANWAPTLWKKWKDVIFKAIELSFDSNSNHEILHLKDFC